MLRFLDRARASPTGASRTQFDVRRLIGSEWLRTHEVEIGCCGAASSRAGRPLADGMEQVVAVGPAAPIAAVPGLQPRRPRGYTVKTAAGACNRNSQSDERLADSGYTVTLGLSDRVGKASRRGPVALIRSPPRKSRRAPIVPRRLRPMSRRPTGPSERAVIREFDSGMTRRKAELAACATPLRLSGLRRSGSHAQGHDAAHSHRAPRSFTSGPLPIPPAPGPSSAHIRAQVSQCEPDQSFVLLA